MTCESNASRHIQAWLVGDRRRLTLSAAASAGLSGRRSAAPSATDGGGGGVASRRCLSAPLSSAARPASCRVWRSPGTSARVAAGSKASRREDKFLPGGGGSTGRSTDTPRGRAQEKREFGSVIANEVNRPIIVWITATASHFDELQEHDTLTGITLLHCQKKNGGTRLSTTPSLCQHKINHLSIKTYHHIITNLRINI